MFSTTMLVAVFYILGIYLADNIGFSATFFLFLFLLISAMVKNHFRRTLFIAAFALLIGVLRYGAACDAPLVRQFPDKYVTAEGTIFSKGTESEGEYKNRYILKLDAVSYIGTTYKTSHRIIINTKEAFEFGDRVRVSGFVSEISGINNEFEYDFSAYYKSRGIYARIVARKAENIGKDFSWTPEFLAGKIKNYIGNVISHHYQGNRAALLKAVLLNDKSDFDKDYEEMLIRTGIYRSLYSPFMHISLIFLLAGLLRRQRADRERLAVILILVYALFNSVSPTIIKACAVSVLIIFRKEILGFADKLEVLSLIVLVLILADPMLCFSSGFVISVMSTVLVYFSYEPIYRKISKFLAKRKLHAPKLCGVLTIWLILTVGTAPVCAMIYNGVSVYSVLFSTLMLPIIGVIAATSAPAILLFALSGSGKGVAVLSNLILQGLEFSTRLAGRLPFSFLELRVPSAREIVIFYILWWIFLQWMSGRVRANKTKILATVAVALMALGISRYSVNTLLVNFVNVEQGDGAVLHTTRGETVLIDGGGAPDYQDGFNLGEEVYVPYLVAHGFTDIDVAILSHCHKDHAEGIVAAAKKLKINTVVMPDTPPDNEYRKELEVLAKERKFKIEYLSAGDEIRFKSGLKIRFLEPQKGQGKGEELNDSSLVAHITYGEFDALFTGDSTGKINDSYPKDVELLKVAHHGSDTASDKEYIDYVSPEYAVISVGEDNPYGLPDLKVLERLSGCGAKILRTDKLGDIRFKIKKDGEIIYNTLKGG